MESKQILDKLNQARRALDSLSQVEIMDEWQFDNELNVWYLHLSIVIECETPYFPQKSQWFFVVGSEYPKGKIKVYPDVENSITVTLYHQANNSKIERNGLWRKGALCLEVNTIPNYQSEPYSVDERLLYHAKRAICWLELAAKGKLVTESEPFELPEFSMSNILEMQFAFSEDVVTFMQWESVECRYGIAELDVYKSKPFVYYVKVFKSLSNNIQHYTEWGKYLSKTTISPPIIAPWILMNQIPVVNEWQAPETFGELLVACEKQHINIMCKELSVCNYLNSLNPHANVKVINDTLSNDDSFKTNIDLDRYDVIVDCTGENNVLDILQRTNFKRTHIIASVSVGLGAKRLYVTLMNGNTFNFNAFYNLISPYLQAEKVLYDDYDLPRNGIGCWHPTFPGRSDDIWIAAATSVKVIENYIISKSQKTLSLIYEQKESDGIFESYEVVEKRENG